MRIVIDARPLSHPQVGGYRSYVRALVRGIAQIDGFGEVLLYLDRPLPPDAPFLPPHMKVRILDRNRLRTDLALFRRQVRRDSPDLVHGTTNCLPPGIPVPTTVTVHDALQIKRYPFIPVSWNARGRLLGWYEACLTRLTAKTTRRIITVSAASAREIGGALKLEADKIKVVYPGLVLSAPEEPVPRANDTVLALASTDPRKNFGLLFQALSLRGRPFSPAPRLEIVCTNATSALYVEEAIRRYGVREVSLRRSLDDGEMSACYSTAAVFVWPSRLEGFGLPPLEAMVTGCPVVSSSAPPMPEVLGEVPLWFHPDHPEQLADALHAFLKDPALRQDAGRRGKAHAAQFTCRRMAEQMRAIWRGALQ